MMFYLRLNLIVLVDALLRLVQVCTPHRLILAKTKNQGGDVTTFYFKPAKPVNYKAGMYGIWMLPKFVKGKPVRLFTIAAGPENELMELTTHVSQSDFKQKLSKLEVGDKVTLFGPIGRFILPKNPERDVVFVAGGIGITPFHAMLQSISAQGLKTKSTLIHSAGDNHVYKSELQKLATKSYFIGRDQLDETLSSVIKTQPSDSVYYVSGPPSFVKNLHDKLKSIGVKHIKLDGFLGYK